MSHYISDHDASEDVEVVIEALKVGLCHVGLFGEEPWLPDLIVIETGVEFVPVLLSFEFFHEGWSVKVSATVRTYTYTGDKAIYEIKHEQFNKED